MPWLTKKYLCWTKGHENNGGNEIADLLAKKKAKGKVMGPQDMCCLSQQTVKVEIMNLWKQHDWHGADPNVYGRRKQRKSSQGAIEESGGHCQETTASSEKRTKIGLYNF